MIGNKSPVSLLCEITKPHINGIRPINALTTIVYKEILLRKSIIISNDNSNLINIKSVQP